GEIDNWTAFGVDRRIKRAISDGADAIVFDIDTPGGELGACLKICNAIKGCPIANTTAWVNPNAYSAGAIIALACREIVVNDPATMGDALPIAFDPLMGIQKLPDAEREKLLGPLLSEVVDSARRNGQDEMLVQGLVRRGVELWLVEHTGTGQRLFVTEAQYRLATGEDPVRSSPQIPSATGVTGGGGSPLPPASAQGGASPAPGMPTADSDTAYVPAAPGTSPVLEREVNATLEIKGAKSTRPDLASPDHAGKYRLVEYVSDGYGLVVLKSASMVRYGVAQAVVKNDEELKARFGATSLARLDETWSEGLARFLTHPVARGVLIVVFLLALFVEMTHPGVALPGAVAAGALLALIVPPVLVDLAAWWSLAAIVLGIVLIAVEVFLIPGFGVFGIGGALLLFAGLIGVFVGGPSGLFPASPRARNDLAFGTLTVMISMATAIVLMYYTAKHLPTIPVFRKFVLNDTRGEESGEGLLSAMGPVEGVVRVGAVGRTLTPLRPAGRVEIDGRIIDVVSDMGFVDAGVQVRIASVERFRTVVEQV
ncbi:MAG: NfeD family protein, partial [Phycisphaerales bacterium]